MNVALVSPFDPNPLTSDGARGHVGGVERVLANVARQLTHRGHDVTLICSHEGPADVRVEDGVRVVREPRRATILRAPLARLAARIPRDADLVHVPATYPFTTPSVLQQARRLGIPSVLDFHFEPDPGTSVGRVAAAAYRRLGPRAYRLAAAVLVRSRAYAASAPSLAGVPVGRCCVVPNGIDPRRFRASGPRQDGDYLLCVGRLVPYKGVEVLLRALATMKDPLPLRVAGDGPLRGELEGLARALDVDARFLGRVPDEALPPLYRGARATVLPSVNGQEAFGITLLESMACGTPVVASRLPGVEDVASEGGLLAAPGDPRGLAAQVARASDPDALPRGHALASRIHRAYSWRAVTDRIVAVYQEVARGKAARGQRLLQE